MEIHIKNMVCPRCIQAVRSILTNMGLTVIDISLGNAVIKEELSCEQRNKLEAELKAVGFELLDDPRSLLVEQIRVSVLEWVRHTSNRSKLSDFLSNKLNRDYSSLSKLFSEVKGITIERFAIEHRVEYAKELLCYSELTTSEIAYKLGYSSPAHLTNQFKQLTGMSPKVFRELEQKGRKCLDEL